MSSYSGGDDLCHILAVDDENSILDIYRDIFDDETDMVQDGISCLRADLFGEASMEPDGQLRFEVTTCTQGDEALDVVREALDQGIRFKVAFVDIRMPPGINGIDTAKQLRQLDPNIIIAFVSGFGGVPIAELKDQIPPAEKLHYFNKPFDIHSLIKLAKTACSFVE